MNRALIPEVLQSLTPRPTPGEKKLSINLTKNYDNRNMYDIHNTYNTTTNNTTINKKGGFFRFLIDVLLLPYIMLRTIWMHIYTKYDLKNKWQIETKKSKLDAWARRYARKNRGLYDMEELY